MATQSLNPCSWTVRAAGEPGGVAGVPGAIASGAAVPATVPGCIHTDLIDAGVIGDPVFGDNESAVQWVSLLDWRYECRFVPEARWLEGSGADLVFECLDTIAAIELNSVPVGQSASEFLPHRFAVSRWLRPGENHLAVTFKSPLRHIRQEEARLGSRPVNGDWDPFVFIRKCASNFQWDWGPRVATCGISGSVSLEPSGAWIPPAPRPPRARLVVDEHDGAFGFEVDGRPFFCQGANWVPEGLFPRDRTPDRVGRRLRQLAAAGVNMLRVWGGGRYEPDWFYQMCDQLGILVWQDFMFSCAMYPEDEPLRSLVEVEARFQVARLAKHPCVVLWCGGNECTWARQCWGWKEKLLPGQTWGGGYYFDLLPRIVAEVDPSRPYWPNSPENGVRGTPDFHPDRDPGDIPTPPIPNDASRGDRHTWEVWGDGYRSVVPRFCSEFGQQSPSNRATLQAAGLAPPPAANIPAPAASTDQLMPPLLASRQRGPGGNARWFDQPMGEWFPPPRDFQQWHYLAQLLQARCMSIGVEWLRCNQPRCAGALLWQANDAWPGLSWSIIDSAGRPKLAWYAVRHSMQPRLLSIHPDPNHPGRVNLFAVNQSATTWRGELFARRISFNGRVHAEQVLTLNASPGSALVLTDLTDALEPPADAATEFIRVQTGDARAEHFFLPDKALRLPAPDVLLSLSTAPQPSHAGQKPALLVTATARSLLRSLCLEADRLHPDAQCDSQLVTLLPGESHTFHVTGLADPAAAAPLEVLAALRDVVDFRGPPPTP